MYLLTAIFREISKLIMFTLTWGCPLYLSRVTGNYYFLWLFAVSFLVTICLFSHYEDLEKANIVEEIQKELKKAKDDKA